ncbi:MAG: hypothetical protein ABH858_04610 [Candidatus Omnitrophota bacterium]
MRCLDVRKREDEILDLLVDSYIKKSHPISSSSLCQEYNLPYSSATIRNVLESLEKKGFLSHPHTSSGRVPTKDGFKHYVESLSKDKESLLKETLIEDLFDIDSIGDFQDILDRVLTGLSNISGYISLIGIWGEREGFFFKGARYILDQPEFEDIIKLRNLFYALEVKIDELQDLLFQCIDEELKIFIGDDIGFEEISDCSLLMSGFKEKDFSLTLALLGPMRMNYTKACESLYSIKCGLENTVKRLL